MKTKRLNSDVSRGNSFLPCVVSLEEILKKRHLFYKTALKEHREIIFSFHIFCNVPAPSRGKQLFQFYT